MIVSLDKQDWREVFKAFCEREDWIEEMNLITFTCSETTSEPIDIDLPAAKAREVGKLLGIIEE